MKNFPLIFSFLIFLSLKPIGYLNDFAGILTKSQIEEIEKILVDIEKETTNEICVVTINSLEGKSIEEYANEIFNSWEIGKKEKDNGVLILVALKERQMRIEVGYGLERYLPDGVSGRIIREIVAPNFKNGDYYNGIKGAILEIYKISKGEISDINKKEDIPPLPFLIFWYFFCILFGFFILGFIGLLLEFLLIVFLGLFAFFNKGNVLYEVFLLASILFPFIFLFILSFISAFFYNRLKRKLKKFYGNKWINHVPLYLKGPNFYSSSGSKGGFSGGFGGFGGGASGGGGATGRW